jgi:paraquat-inducible protein B
LSAMAILDRAGEVLQHTEATVNDPSLMYQLTRTLQEVSAAARSVRLLTGYLERNPSAVLVGRPTGGKK